jgi:hypothetical protein
MLIFDGLLFFSQLQHRYKAGDMVIHHRSRVHKVGKSDGIRYHVHAGI